jgi:flavin reductase (DIM6/NTAB) family NADH-FMN oxidoreductase RutF
MKDLPLSKIYQLLEPGPVILLTTARKGHANIMTLSWYMMVEFEPPLIACVVSNANHSFAALRATKECVIAIPALELAPKVVAIGNCSGRDVDKFKRFRLTPAPAKRVAPPLVASTSSTSSSWRWSRLGRIRRRSIQRRSTITGTEGSPWMER